MNFTFQGCFTHYIFCYLPVVIDRICVRHRADSGKPTPRGGGASGFNGLFIFLPGFPEMHVHVY